MKVTEQELRAVEDLRLSLRRLGSGGTTFIHFHLEELAQRIKASLERDKSRKEYSVPKCEIEFSDNNWSIGDFIFNGKSYGFALNVGTRHRSSYKLMRFNHNYMTKRGIESVREAFRAAKKSDETVAIMEKLANEYFLFLRHYRNVSAKRIINLFILTGFNFLHSGNFTDDSKRDFVRIDIPNA